MAHHRDLVVIGASAGGVEALRALVGALPADLPAAVLVVLHVPREPPSALPGILSRSGRLPAAAATDGEELRPGLIRVAPGDWHLLVLDGRIRLSRGPAENGHRPAIDPLFRSAARALGPRVISVVLSGSRDDGAAGAAAVAAQGGTVLVQSPDEALHPSMPRAALALVPAAQAAPAAGLGKLIGELAAAPIGERGDEPVAGTRLDAEVAVSAFAHLTTDRLPGLDPGFGCPSCGGSLAEIDDEGGRRYRCRVGHAWSPESLLAEHAVATEGALWTALRALTEKSALSRRMAGDWAGRRQGDRYTALADDADRAGVLIRELLHRLGGSTAAQEE